MGFETGTRPAQAAVHGPCACSVLVSLWPVKKFPAKIGTYSSLHISLAWPFGRPFVCSALTHCFITVHF